MKVCQLCDSRIETLYETQAEILNGVRRGDGYEESFLFLQSSCNHAFV